MRLTPQQIEGIIAGVRQLFSGNFELRLYGSRVNDTARGGDIDLLIITNHENKKILLEKKHKILSAIKSRIGDQKIDLCIAEKSELETDPFLKVVFPQSVELIA